MRDSSFIVLVALLLSLAATTQAKEVKTKWGYININDNSTILPEKWYKISSKCIGERQSPINIDTKTTRYDAELKPIEIVKYEIQLSKKNKAPLLARSYTNDDYWHKQNTGSGINYTPINKVFSIRLWPEDDEYRLVQFHFHWKSSEHTINDRRYAAELHLVHKCVKTPNKLAVIGFFFELSNTENKQLRPFIEKVTRLKEVNSTVLTPDIVLNNLLPSKIERYFRYVGSLTTPGCDEIVEWFVADAPILTLSESQLAKLQSIKGLNGQLLLTNARPIQPLNKRIVRRSFL